ncbi:response regulator [Seongchinamella sediminis]|uniref:Chemotaxis protein CheA n=2 Tax=Seongchinamella sediminis TaxID=2283635 RepID=A0A3L7E453_9GAMM|nr:response regulator [Seongchinamella sediminis]
MLDTVESSKESTLEWLMELDRDEPEENLFVVEGKRSADFSLSAYEAEVAARPMVRGRAGADDLDTYIGEEIVLSEPGGNDIYSTSASAETDTAQAKEEEAFEGLMAIEFSRASNEEAEGLATNVVDGSDILGLQDDDDIGDSYLVVKRVKKAATADPQPEIAAAAEPAPLVEAEPVPEPSLAEVNAADFGEEITLEALPLEPDVEDAIDLSVETVVTESLPEPTGDAPADLAGTEPAAAEVEPTDVDDYVNSVPLPDDDQAFDDFLVAGNNLAVGEDDFDGLSLEASNDQFRADASVDSDLDLHEDFAAMAGFGDDLMAVITPRLADFMDEVNAAITARLSALGRPSGSVIADVSIATDEQTASLAVKQGYEPVSSICTEVPEALTGLERRQVEAVLLRLVEVASGANCNRLFQDEPAPAAAADESVLTVVESSIPGDDIFADEFDTEQLPPADWAPDDGEIDALFDDLDGEELDLVADNMAAASGEDIDQLFSDLGMASENSGEICGVELEEFAGTEGESGSEPVAAEPAVAAAATATDEDMSWCIPAGIHFSHSSPGGGEIFAEFLDAFIEEGSSELEKLEDAISGWEADIGSDASYTQVARILHTIKGIAKGVGLHYYGTLIHNFETLLDALSRPAAEGAADYFRIVNAWLDAAVRGMDFVQDQRRDIVSEFPHRRVSPAAVAEPVVAAPAPEEPAEEQPVTAAEVVDPAPRPAGDSRRKQEDKKLADEGARALAAQQSVRITSEKLDLLLNLTNQAQQLGVRTAQSTNRNKRASAELQGRLSSVRAQIADIADRALFNVNARTSNHSAELDALEMDQYSELQEAANILREGVEDLADLIEVASRHNAQAEALLKQQATVIGSIGSSIRAARVVPVSRLMPGLRRLVRTVSNDLGKDVAFRVANEVGTLDRDDYARCQTILEHMVRNALDHGIESVAERKASGKPSVGQITLDVRMSGSDSIIVLSDDGRGIDPEAMRESAVRKGLDVDAYALSDDEALNLIFHKGFSTAAQLSQISGRGVGMDIVRSELQEMGGDIRIESQVGKGTSFHVRIPTNVTVNGALLVSAGENSYAIPLGGLVYVDEVPVEQFFAAVERGERLQLSGMDCEPAYLGTLCNSGSLPDRSSWRSTLPVIVAGSEARYMAIAIDDVEEALELVIRSLGVQFASVPGVAGAATTADGEAVVALDLNVLVSCYGEGQAIAVPDDQPDEDKFVALVVDDSRTQRMVATSQLETVGIETATAENGAVAIDWLNTTEQLPDVILLDVEMPVKDGIQTLREIRNSARFNHIPVIMITSRTGVKHRTLAEEAGCNGYMGKPFNFRMLIGQINELTGQRLELG